MKLQGIKRLKQNTAQFKATDYIQAPDTNTLTCTLYLSLLAVGTSNVSVCVNLYLWLSVTFRNSKMMLFLLQKWVFYNRERDIQGEQEKEQKNKNRMELYCRLLGVAV